MPAGMIDTEYENEKPMNTITLLMITLMRFEIYIDTISEKCIPKSITDTNDETRYNFDLQ